MNDNHDKSKAIAEYLFTLTTGMADVIDDSIYALLTEGSVDLQGDMIHAAELRNELLKKGLFQEYLKDSPPDDIPLEIYSFLYALKLRKQSKKENCRNYESLKSSIAFPEQMQHYVIERILHALVVLQVLENKISWQEFTSGFTGKDWTDICVLGSSLSSLGISVEDTMKWLKVVIEQNENDGGLNEVGQSIHNWVIYNPDLFDMIEAELSTITTDKHLIKFVSPILNGMQKVNPHNLNHYTQILDETIGPSNAYNILYALGMMSNSTSEGWEGFYKYLLDKTNTGTVLNPDFISLCSQFRLYKKELFEKIESLIIESNDKDFLHSVINLLYFDDQNCLNRDWIIGTAKLLVSKHDEKLTQFLDRLVSKYAKNDLALAYDIFEFRLRIMGPEGMLKNALIEMILKDHSLFHQKLVGWFTEEDSHLHFGLRGICSIHKIDKSLFNIPAAIFSNVTVLDKIYMAHKLAGYIYSMEQMQALFISLVKSVDRQHDDLYRTFHFILSEYIIYNYRSTLKLLREEVENEELLNEFALRLFKQLISEYDAYFANLRRIENKKELTPYKNFELYKSFYLRKEFEKVPKRPDPTSIINFFKPTSINSNRWAIRRPGEEKHTAQELGHYSFSAEFPSGENLNPVRQEHMRKSYQNITKNEININ